MTIDLVAFSRFLQQANDVHDERHLMKTFETTSWGRIVLGVAKRGALLCIEHVNDFTQRANVIPILAQTDEIFLTVFRVESIQTMLYCTFASKVASITANLPSNAFLQTPWRSSRTEVGKYRTAPPVRRSE